MHKKYHHQAPWIAISAAIFTLLAGCDAPRAHGDVQAVIVASSPALWDAVEMDLEDAIAPTIQVVRSERTFRVAWQDPAESGPWANLQRFRNVLAIGAPGDFWIDAALAALPRGSAVPLAPSVFRVDNVWARGQTVTVALLPQQDDEEALLGLLQEINQVLDRQYRDFATSRMFVSGRDTILADSLATHVGFRLAFPVVYRYSVRDSVYRFRNDNPSPAELIREVGVTWISPLPAELPTETELAAWRTDFTAAYYNDPQMVDTYLTSTRPIQTPGVAIPGFEFQASWASPPGAWPAGGPSLTRVLPCPAQDRLYFVDAWLYAPTREKYEYMIQLETILDSFRCSP
jgi:hypothetical protein